MTNFSSGSPFALKPRSTGRTRLARHPLGDLDGLASTGRHQRGDMICRETQGGDFLYRLISGAALRLGARRQALDIITPGDYFGFRIGDDEGVAIEAAEDDTTVFVYPRWCVSFLTDVSPAAGRVLRDLELEAIVRTRFHLFCRRRMSAAAKISSLLIEMDDRMTLSATGWFELPAPLDAIADYLELSSSTLEFGLSFLARSGVIARAGGRCVRIDDRLALEKEGSRPALDDVQTLGSVSDLRLYRTYCKGSDPLAAPRVVGFSRVR